MTMICGTDVSYKKGIAQSSAVLVQSNTLEVLESCIFQSPITTPYVSGLLMLRESGPHFGAKITKE